MTERKSKMRQIMRILLLEAAGMAAVAGLIVFEALAVPPKVQSEATQSPATQTLKAMEAAGVKMSFDVASVKLDKSDSPAYSNVSMSPNAAFSPTGGLFSATNFRLQSYLAWAYDLSGYEALRLLGQYPEWAVADHFDIEARAQGNPTKPEMQLMMQSLLADRFKLVVHHETKQGRVYALVLLKAGKTGSQLQPHVDDGSCSTPAPPPTADTTARIPPPCGIGVTGLPSTVAGRAAFRGRDMTMEQIAAFLPAFGGGVDRPVLDRTGLSGTFDFTIEFALGALPKGAAGPPNLTPDESGPTFFEALQDELGLKLVSQTGPVNVLVIDHVEEPSAN